MSRKPNTTEGLHINEMGKRLFQNKEGIHSQYDLLGDYKYLQRSAQSTFERSNYWEKGKTKKNRIIIIMMKDLLILKQQVQEKQELITNGK